jgi:hypothetical protein
VLLDDPPVGSVTPLAVPVVAPPEVSAIECEIVLPVGALGGAVVAAPVGAAGEVEAPEPHVNTI